MIQVSEMHSNTYDKIVKDWIVGLVMWTSSLSIG